MDTDGKRAPDRIKRQHYVPRSYLKRFTADGPWVFVFDKLEGKSFQTNIKNVAVEAGFHDLPPETLNPGTDVQIAETVLAELETDFSKTASSLLQTVERGNLISAKQKEVMAFFVALQHLRTLS